MFAGDDFVGDIDLARSECLTVSHVYRGKFKHHIAFNCRSGIEYQPAVPSAQLCLVKFPPLASYYAPRLLGSVCCSILRYAGGNPGHLRWSCPLQGQT